MTEPTDLNAARKEKEMLADAHELMAKVYKNAKRLVEASSTMLDVLMKPQSQHALDHATRRFHHAALDALAAADAYAKKYVHIGEKKNEDA